MRIFEIDFFSLFKNPLKYSFALLLIYFKKTYLEYYQLLSHIQTCYTEKYTSIINLFIIIYVKMKF